MARRKKRKDLTLSKLTSADVLGQDGLLSQNIPGFVLREAQQKMAEVVEKSLELTTELIIEAGTGTGKTFGYLVPVFLSNKKTIISTGTKTLQDQLFFSDIPRIKNIMGYEGKVALLKGRANYLCKYRLEKNLQDGRFTSQKVVAEMQEIQQWSQGTKAGDIAEATMIAEDSPVWPYVTSTADNCLSQDCPFYHECFVVKARQYALSADVVIVNHHLFFADLALQEDGFGELLPGADAIIFDEAHHLPDVVSNFFSTSLTGRQLVELTRDVDAEILTSAKDLSSLSEYTRKLQHGVHDMRLALGHEVRRALWPERFPSALKESIENIEQLLKQIEESLKEAAVRSKGLENCWRRSILLLERFHLLTAESPENTIHWFETYAQSFSLQHTPLVVAEQFKQHLESKKRTWIFTSATLTVRDTFQLFKDTLGLHNALQLQLKSPFDYKTQSLLYVPRGLPDPRAHGYVTAMSEAILPILKANGGRTFILFTSYKMMEEVWQQIQMEVPFPMLVQGSMPKKELIHQFKTLGNAILFGTSSFWYGVDVQGEALSCVIIDKLPFSAPEDPILQARIRLLRKQGMDPFQYYQLPNAVLAFKQGAGRLIRDAKDRGILMVCDPRLVGSAYGAAFLQSLPDMPRTRDLDKVLAFPQFSH